MRFVSPPAANRTLGVLPLLAVSLLPALLVLAAMCMSLKHEEESIRLPDGTLCRPPRVRQTPAIPVLLSRQGTVTLAGQTIAGETLAAAWQREQAALRLLGYEPSQATVIVRADRNVPIEQVQGLMETAQRAGFTQCVLRAMEREEAHAWQANEHAVQAPGGKP